jgi:predicted Zn-dependent protease
LIKLALENGDSQAALNLLNDGESFDCTHNDGKRRNDYELRRGQILAKRGDAEAANDAFTRLIARDPADLRFQSSAAESMLSAKQGERALHFAEQGLATALKQNNRDSEQHFKELAAAARRSLGRT